MTTRRPLPFRPRLVVPLVVVDWAGVEPAVWVWVASWLALVGYCWLIAA